MARTERLSISFGRYSSIAPDYNTKIFSSSTTPAHLSRQYANYGFIAVLGLAQRLHIRFLPLTWEAVRGPIGGGGQAEINEALADIQISFAFKGFNHRPQDPFGEAIQEMVVLSHPVIREHKHIVRLVGICWDIPEASQVWPVLVFQKAHLGDLFKSTKRLKGLAIEDRLSLCADVGTAIRDMHHNGIIHGDIKPDNVLIFEEDTRIIAKVADFGFSTCFHDENDLVLLPRSEPWNAPEHSTRYFRIEEAKKMDIYSFALLCVWLLFEAGSSGCPSFPLNTTPEAGQFVSFGEWESEKNLLRLLKHDADNKLIDWASWLVCEDKNLKDDAKNKLIEFLRSTLTFDPQSRCTDFERLLGLLVPSRILPITEPIQISPVPEEEIFKVAVSIREFYMADFRLRSFIVNSLRAIVARSEGATLQHTSISKAALQLALCHMIGFGGFKDDDLAEYLFQKYSLEFESFQSDIKLISDTTISGNTEEDLLRESERYSALELKAYKQRIDLPEYYRERSLLDQATMNYECEIQAVEQVIGKENTVWRELKSAMAEIMRYRGRLKEAIQLEGEVLEMQKDMWGEKHAYTLNSMAQISILLLDQGEIEEAKKLLTQILKVSEGIQDSDLNLQALSNLATAYMHEGQWVQAKEIIIRVANTRMKLLGPEHPLTLKSMDKLATASSELGQWDEAERLGKQVLEMRKKVSSEGNLDLLLSMNNLALTFWDQGQLEKCREQLRQMIRMGVKELDIEHPYVLASLDNLAVLYWDQHRRDEALILMRAVEGACTRKMGDAHPQTVGARGLLQEWEESLSRERHLSVLERELLREQGAADRERANLERILGILTEPMEELALKEELSARQLAV